MRAFKIGERVRMTRKALRRGLQGRATSPYGRVVAYTPGRVSRLRVKVQRDGIKRPEWYSRNFWVAAPRGGKGGA